jgi:hypothetical protein
MTAATRRLNVPAGPLKEMSDTVLTSPILAAGARWRAGD